MKNIQKTLGLGLLISLSCLTHSFTVIAQKSTGQQPIKINKITSNPKKITFSRNQTIKQSSSNLNEQAAPKPSILAESNLNKQAAPKSSILAEDYRSYQLDTALPEYIDFQTSDLIQDTQSASPHISAAQKNGPASSWGSFLTNYAGKALTNIHQTAATAYKSGQDIWDNISTPIDQDEPSFDMQENAEYHANLNNQAAQRFTNPQQNLAIVPHSARITALNMQKNGTSIQNTTTSNPQKQGTLVEPGFDIPEIETPLLNVVTKRATPFTNFAGKVIATADDYAARIISSIDQGAEIADSYLEPHINTVIDAASNVQQAIANPQQTFKSATNAAIRQGISYAKTALTTPAKPVDADAPSFIDQETHDALGDLFNEGTQVAAKGISTFAKNSLSSRVPNTSQTSSQPNSYSFTPETQEIINNTKTDVMSNLVKSLRNSVKQLLGDPPNPVILEEQAVKKENTGKALAAKPLLKAQTKTTPLTNVATLSAAMDASVPEISVTTPVKTSSVVGYFTNKFQKTAQGLKKSPAAIKNFVKNVGDTISSMVSLTEKETIMLNNLVDQEVNELTNNKASFTHADSKTFSLKFNAWLKGFVNKSYKLAGKPSPTKLKVVSIQEQPTDPLAPTVAFTFDGDNLQGATISYNNYSYKIPNENMVLNADGSYSVKDLPLYDKKTPQTALQLIHGGLYNSTVKNTIAAPLKKSDIGKALGSDTIDMAEDALLANPTQAITKLSIDYKPNKSIIMKETNIKTNIATTKKYSASGKLEEQIIDMPTIGIEDVFTPDIELTYNPITKKFDTINITHKNPITETKNKQSSIVQTKDEQTGILRIEASYEAPASTPQAIKTQAIQYLKKNGLITDKTSTDTLEKIEAILDTVGPLIAEYPEQTFTNIVNNFGKIASQSGYVPANLVKLTTASISQDTLNALNAFLLEPLPTSIQSVVIEYNPITQQIAKNVVKRMAKGDPKQVTSAYEADGSLISETNPYESLLDRLS